MPGFGHQHRGGHAVLGGVGERGVPQVVQGPSAAGLGEEFRGASVGQPGSAGVRVEVGRGELHAGGAFGEKHRASGAPGELAGQQPGGAGLPGDLLYRPAFAVHDRTAVGPVQIADVEAQNLMGPGGGLIQASR